MNNDKSQSLWKNCFLFVLPLIAAVIAGLLMTIAGCQSDAGMGDVRIYRPHAKRAGLVRKGHFTIVLDIFDQPGSQQAAESFRKQAMLKLGSNDVWIYNDFGVLDVNYGHFDTHAEAKQQIDRVHKLFGMSYIREIPKPDPPAPTAWNLLNSPCFYSLEIATYYDVPKKGFYDRKESAVKAVERLRKLGEKAYFVHGRASSCVYVGCFGPGDLRTTWKNGLRIRTPSPALQAMINKYPVHYENGFKIYYHKIRTIDGQQKESPRIPYPNRVVMVNALRQNIPF